MTEEERATIAACADPGKLDRWIVKAATVPTVGEVLEPEKKVRAKQPPVRAPKGLARGAKRRSTRE